MAPPTVDDILDIYEELNYPRAAKLRAELLKRGFKARLKDVDEFVKSQTPTQLFGKAPKYRGESLRRGPTRDGSLILSTIRPSPVVNLNTYFWCRISSVANFLPRPWSIN